MGLRGHVEPSVLRDTRLEPAGHNEPQAMHGLDDRLGLCGQGEQGELGLAGRGERLELGGLDEQQGVREIVDLLGLHARGKRVKPRDEQPGLGLCRHDDRLELGDEQLD